MAAFYDPSEPVPDWWSPREPLGYYGRRERQEGRWRESSAFRRLKAAQHAWLLEHGYAGKQGHADWSSFRRDCNRPAYYGGPRPGPDRQEM